MKELTFKRFSKTNLRRCEKHFHKLNDWNHQEWACALAGEVGELCNFLKKMKRGETISKKALADELGDILAYTDLLASSLGLNLGTCVKNKFNEVSDRKKSKIKL